MEFAISQSKMVRLPRKKSKHIDWTLGLKCDHRVWPWPWPWPWISRWNIEFAISQLKMVWLPRNEKQTYRLNSRPQMWPSGLTLAMTLTLIFKVKYGCYISAKNGPIATKRKANIVIELQAANVTNGFDFGHDLDLEFSRSNMEVAISQPKMVWLPRSEKQT